MTWQTDIADAVIETQAGDRFVFEFRDLTAQRTDRTKTFQFRTDGDYVQKKSAGSMRLPITLWFSGSLCHEMADSFETAAKDPRPMWFYHPLRKKRYRVQLLGYTRTDALATAAGEVKFDLDLHQTIELEKQLKPENVSKFIDTTINYVAQISAAQYGEAMSKKTPGELAKIKAALEQALAKMSAVTAAYDMATDYVAQAQAALLTAESLVSTIEADAAAFAEVAFGVFRSIQNSILYVTDKFDFYRQMVEDLGAGEGALEDPATFKLMNNAMLSEKCRTASATTADDYQTKTAVFDLSDEIFEQQADIVAQIEAFEAEDEISGVPRLEPDIETMAAMTSIVAAAAGRLTEIAYVARQRRTVTLDRDTDLYTLVYRIMGPKTPDELDTMIDEVIAANRIGGSELFWLKKGRVITYYI